MTITKAVINRLVSENLEYKFIVNESLIKIFLNEKVYSMNVFDYPFKPPTNLKVNNKDVRYSLMTRNIMYESIKFFGINCLCCISVLCANNWLIGIKFTDIINEYERSLKLVKYCDIYRILKNNNIFDRIPEELEFYIMGYLSPIL